MAQANSPQTEPSAKAQRAGDPRHGNTVPLQPSPVSSDATENLTQLFHMSPTAGVGTTDYSAINSLSIVALLLGLGSVAALSSNVLLLIPLAGLVCSLAAFRQILQSNGTQAGKSFAAIGLICSLSMGGGTVAWRLVNYRHTVDDQRQIAQQIANVGDDITQDRLPELYARFSDRFKARVSLDAFVARMSVLNNYAHLGKLTAVRWNDEPMIFEGGGDGSERSATALAFLTFSKVAEPSRELFIFTHRDNHWTLENIPLMFPTEKPKPAGPRALSHANVTPRPN